MADYTFYTNPMSRGQIVRWALHEAGADYEQVLVDWADKGALDKHNPMGKVPAIRHGDAVVTEQPAVYTYLADLFPEAGLAPRIGDPLRGPYLRWLVFYGSSFEPAIIDRSQQRAPAPLASSPYGDYDTMLGALTGQLSRGPWLLGERFTAADVLWGVALAWTTGFKLVPALPSIQAYVERVNARPAVARAREKDARLAEAQG